MEGHLAEAAYEIPGVVVLHGVSSASWLDAEMSILSPRASVASYSVQDLHAQRKAGGSVSGNAAEESLLNSCEKSWLTGATKRVAVVF